MTHEDKIEKTARAAQERMQTQQERIELLADFAEALFAFVDVLEQPVEASFHELLKRETFAAIATPELRKTFTDELE